MSTGAITPYIDVAQLTLYAFWIFFAGLIIYLHRENKREGYPLESERSPHVKSEGFPAVPEPKTFLLANGQTVTAPHRRDDARTPIAAAKAGNFPGAPLQPSGNPFVDNVGPGSWTQRADVADVTFEGTIKIVPLRVTGGWGVADGDPDPRGMPVLGADRQVGGTVRDLWVDRSEMLFRYLEVEVAGGRSVLLPMNFAKVNDRNVAVRSILGGQFAGVPGTKHPEQVTLLEEEKIMAYYGAGTLYATADRSEPLL
jgi:photosynthetic reaction center H subunit